MPPAAGLGSSCTTSLDLSRNQQRKYNMGARGACEVAHLLAARSGLCGRARQGERRALHVCLLAAAEVYRQRLRRAWGHLRRRAAHAGMHAWLEVGMAPAPLSCP